MATTNKTKSLFLSPIFLLLLRAIALQQGGMKIGTAFQPSPISSLGANLFEHSCYGPSTPTTIFTSLRSITRSRGIKLYMTTSVDLDSRDPFVVLGLDPNDPSSLDKKVIKRAYKRLALTYHPDVATNQQSTDEERRRASEQFAKINAAYETLLRGGGRGTSSASATSSSTSSGGWTPPHRRAQSYTSTSSSGSNPYSGGSRGSGTSWEDFMPKYNDEDYNSGGDSFGSIFADLLAGAAGAAAGYSSRGGGVFNDFVEFLERNVDGYSSDAFGGTGSQKGGDDADLEFLLQTGTVQEVGDEMDDTDLVVQQLSSKLNDLDQEILTIKADLAGGNLKFSEKIALQERQSESEARKGVVEKYLKHARKRLLALQTRYKQLIVGGANDSKAGYSGGGPTSDNRSRGSSSWDTTRTASTDSPTSSSTSSYASSNRRSDQEEAWKTEGFGSSGRGRGSGRRRTSQSRSRTGSSSYSSTTSSGTGNAGTGTASSTSQSASAKDDAGYRSNASERSQSRPNTSTTRQPTPSTGSSPGEYVPPHRRTSDYAKQIQDDKQRLRDLKVDDEFEKLKKELGL